MPSAAKKNTPGLGIEYEVHLPAYFALLLNTNSEVEDFKLQSNVQDFGKLDDLLVDIETKSGENFYFGFQLKHKDESNKNLLPTNFEAKGKKAHFSLEKYCEAFKELNEENRKRYHFILYTNKKFDYSHANQVHKFDMKQDECCMRRNYFDTSDGDSEHLYKFEVNQETENGENVTKEDFREFFSKFSLYTGQSNARNLEKYILKILKYEECSVKYVNFFRKWHKGEFTDKVLDKETLNAHLLDIFLSSVATNRAINYHLSDSRNENSIFFESLVQQFDITIIDDSKQDFIKQLKENIYEYNESIEEAMIRFAKDTKFIDKFAKELKEETKLRLLHYFFQKPLIINFQESSEYVIIYEASKLCRIRENGIKLFIVGRGINVRKFSHLRVFKNLTRVNGKDLEEIKSRCKLSFQGRNISFEDIFENGIREIVTPRELFQMLKGSFSIGEDKENLPECYIPRNVSINVFDIELIIKHSSRSTAIIFYYEGKFEELKILIQNIVDTQEYLYENFLDGIILRKKEPSKKELCQGNIRDTFPEIMILRREESSRKQFDEIHKEISAQETSSNDDISEERDVYLFKVLDEKRCLLLMSTKNIFYNQNYESSKMSVEENNIHVFFNNSVNILCAQPGMGKSTLMRYLNNVCGPNFWTVKVDLKAHNHYMKRNYNIEDVLYYFLELEKGQDLFLSNIKRMFLRRKEIALFLDGLDEVENECVDSVLNITRQLSEMGFRIWLSSRQNLQQKIEQYFNIFTIEINEVNDNQQKNYIENRLTSLYNKNEIKEIVDLIFSNTDLANNRQILEIPLQLYIITQIFLDDKSHYFNLKKNNLFTLTKMFEIFFEGKYQHYLAKIELKHDHFLGGLEEKLENYEILALHSVLDDEHFQKLQVEKITPTQIKIWDLLGIVTEINNENKAVFEHLTYAEYFAAKFLAKNFDKARLLKEEIFTQKYQNLLLIFNIMLAEDSPLHLAIIYKDLSRIEKMGQSSLVDKGGRNFLQVAACIATRHPPLESSKKLFSSVCLVKDMFVKHFKGEDLKIKEIVNRVLPSEPFKNDKIFEWNSLDYALANGALYIVDALLEKSEKPFNYNETLGQYYSDEVVAYYSIRFGYHRLLSEILAKKSCRVTSIVTPTVLKKWNISILHLIFDMSESTNRKSIVELLTGDDINKIVSGANSFLHLSAYHSDIEVVKFLMQKGADVNVGCKYGWSPLFCAAQGGNFEISRLLVEKGADVNIKYKNGRSPLFSAVNQNNFRISKLLVEKGADVNIKDKQDDTPLFLAIKRNSFKISKLLVENGADLNIKDKNGCSPLFFAVNQNNFGISKLLVEKGADVNIKDKDGWSPLRYAVVLDNYETSKLLAEKGADLNIKDKNGRSPLFSAVNQNNFRISKLLVEKGADVNIKDKQDDTPLFLAIKRNNFEISKLLVENGAHFNIKDKDGRSPLFRAVERDNLEISKLLVERGAEVNCESNEPILSVMKSVKLLFCLEANVNESKKTSRVLRLAAEKGNFNLVQILIENGAIWDEQIILNAIKGSNNQIFNLFLSKGVDLSKVNGVLHRAVRYNKTDLVNHLIENGADVNFQNDGFTILHEASARGHLGIVEILLNNPKTAHLLHVPAQEGSTCLHLAVYYGQVKVVELLLETEIDLNKIDIHNIEFPLHFATIGGSLQKELLIKMTRVVNKLLFFIRKLNHRFYDDWELHKSGSTKRIIDYLQNHPVDSNHDLQDVKYQFGDIFHFSLDFSGN